jgi:NDP-sugar pyrophosphorylase family protein
VIAARVMILCGGLGTRLRPAVADVPKVLAPIAGRPFLDLLIGELHRAGARRFVLLAGHRADQVARHQATLRRTFPDCELAISVEPAALGTAGAIRHAASFVDGTFVLVNGDTLCELDLGGLIVAHRAHGAAMTLAAAHVDDTSRYGALEVASDGALRALRDAPTPGPGLINAGVYVIEPDVVDAIPRDRAASLERELLPALIAAGRRVHVVPHRGGVIDIGTPDSWAALASGHAGWRFGHGR